MSETPASTNDSPAKTAVFSQRNVTRPALPILLAAPHGGRDYPHDLLDRMRAPEFSTLRLEDRLIDVIAKGIADQLGAPLIIAHTPRAMLDLNRAPDDVDWSMVTGSSPPEIRNSLVNRRARGGLGLVPRKLPKLGEIWKRPLSQRELQNRIERIHRPYHTAIAQALGHIRDCWGAALLIDLHSMPPLRRTHPGEQPARFVLGDRFGASCDGMLVAGAFRYFSQNDQLAAHNRPYSGGYILDRHARPAGNIHALQLEICRSVYLDEKMAELSGDADGLIAMLTGLVRTLADEVAGMGRTRGQPLAAE